MSALKSPERVNEVIKLRDLIRSCDSETKQKILLSTTIGQRLTQTNQDFFESISEHDFKDAFDRATEIAGQEARQPK